MKNVWIFITFGFLLISAVRPHPADDKQLDNVDDVDGYLGEEADRDGAEDGDEEDSGPPPILRSQNDTFYVSEGDSLRLPCKIENSDSGVVMWWLENTILWSDKIVMMAVEHPNFKLSEDHSIMIGGLKREDSGKFKCVVAHGGKQQSVSYEVHVSVPPKVSRIVPDGPKKTVEKGSPLTLMCEAVGDPTPSISWTKKTKHGEEKLEGSKISIDMVNRKHSGVYECKASNNKGEFDTKSVDIHVLYAPEVEVENDIVYNGEGYETVLICIVHGEPKAKVHWLKEEQPLSFAHHHITVADKGNKHSLIIAGTTKADFGVYKCVAENTKGSSSKIITLSGKPTKPKFHAAEESVDTKSPVLSWSIDSFAPILSYELLYRLQDKGEWKSIDVGVEPPSTPSSNKYIARHTLAGLEPGIYQAQLRAKNEFGWSELSEPHAFSGSVLTAVNELSETSLLESSNNNPNAASELRISFALVISLLVARYYC